MTIHFNNIAKRIGTKNIRNAEYNWFKWRIFVDESDKVLQSIDYVEYHLHPTFPGPIRKIGKERRSSKFYLESEGFGGFKMDIIVGFEGGRKEEYSYFLDVTLENWPESD